MTAFYYYKLLCQETLVLLIPSKIQLHCQIRCMQRTVWDTRLCYVTCWFFLSESYKAFPKQGVVHVAVTLTTCRFEIFQGHQGTHILLQYKINMHGRAYLTTRFAIAVSTRQNRLNSTFKIIPQLNCQIHANGVYTS